jgi:DNA helicase II / ATP-dependent DNA helicase PcrA
MILDYNSIFEDKYKTLNPAQREAVDTIDGPVMVLAGPGAGKTQLLSLRVANILKLTDSRPFNILCLTFTDSGAKNMKDRLASIIGPDAYKVNILTFHGFAKQLMNLYPHKFFEGAIPKLMDDYTRKQLYKSILEEVRSNNFKNDLTSYNQEQGFVYQSYIDSRIKQLKGNGITPTKLEEILNRNARELNTLSELLSPIFSQTMSIKVYETIPTLINQLKDFYTNSFTDKDQLGQVPTLTLKYTQKLIEAYQKYQDDPTVKAKPLSAFKSQLLKKSANSKYVPQELEHHSKLVDLNEIYYIYEQKMSELTNIDFDDLVRMAVEALTKDQGLRMEMQSKFQYVLVDEFQDTSLLQLSLITSLLDMEITNGRPNILVVGDDDQSIYKFQGASLDNLDRFIGYFPVEPKLVVLNTNYRSKKSLVELSQEIVSQSEVRFATKYNVDKAVVPHSNEEGSIEFLKYNTMYDEVADICKRIIALREGGVDLSEIAILARNHSQIVPFAKQLEKKQIPLKYEKGQDILKSQHIRELIKLSKLILELSELNRVDELISDVLSSEYWKLEGIDKYRLAIKVKQTKSTWLDTMLDARNNGLNPYLAEIGEWLVEVANLAKRYSAERLLDVLIGQHAEIGSEQGEVELDPSLDEATKKWRLTLDKLTKFSPFGSYYYNYNRLNLDYLATLSALKTLIHKVREYKKNNFLKIGDLVEFFEFHESEKIAIIDNNVFNQDANAVTLMTGHKAKGLEYEHVFVISSNNDIWFRSKGRNMLPLPINLPFEAAAEDTDDYLRLFYVAITRAKTHLYITRFENTESAKLTEPVAVIVNKEFKKIDVPTHELAEIVTDNIFDAQVIVNTEISNVLKPLIDEYKMPITHMWNYIDLDNDKGPKYFIENNLLRYPCSKNPSSSYGTAIHSALYSYYVQRLNRIYTQQDFIDAFVIALGEENLAEKDYKHYEAKGIETLKYYYSTRKPEEDYKLEVDFSTMDVHIGDAWVTGKIDKVIINKDSKTLDIIDYKTGKGFESFIKAAKNKENYKTQLLFYKLMIDHSSYLENKYTVGNLALDFVEKGENTGVKYLDYSDMSKEIEELKQLINVVYKRITNLQFDVPESIMLLKKDKNIAFKEWLLSDNQK